MMAPHRMRARRGAALAVALLALLAVAALVQAIINPAIAHRRAVTRAAGHQAAESLVESAVATVLGERPASWWSELAIGASRHESGPVTAALPGAPTGSAEAWATTHRLTEGTFVVVAEARVRMLDHPVWARRVLFVERVVEAAPSLPGLTAGGSVALGAGDEVARDEGCLHDGADSAGVVLVAPDADVTWPRSGSADIVDRDAAAGDPMTYQNPGGLQLERLRDGAEIALPPGMSLQPFPDATEGACVPGADNWGEPLRGSPEVVEPCTPAYPIVHARGDLRVMGGRGQGVLLVDGRLEIVGPFTYHGIIVANGGIEGSGGSISVVGAVLTGPTAPASFSAVETRITASRCAIQRAFDAAARMAPLTGWAWGR